MKVETICSRTLTSLDAEADYGCASCACNLKEKVFTVTVSLYVVLVSSLNSGNRFAITKRWEIGMKKNEKSLIVPWSSTMSRHVACRTVGEPNATPNRFAEQNA